MYMIKEPIFSGQGFYIFQAHSASYGLYSMYRKKVFAAFKLNKKNRNVPVLVSEKKTMLCLSQAKPFRKSQPPLRARADDGKIIRTKGCTMQF